MSPCSFPPYRSGSWDVSNRLDLQFLLAAPGTLETNSSRLSHHSSYGGWLDRPRLEHVGTLELSHRTIALERAKATRATKEAGRADRIRGQTKEGPISPSAFASSASGEIVLHQLVWLYQRCGNLPSSVTPVLNVTRPHPTLKMGVGRSLCFCPGCHK